MTIYDDDRDRRRFLEVLAEVAEAEQLLCHAYCLMLNHYHLVVTTAHANLSRALKEVNGRYAQWWNHRHTRVGHVFQGRFWSQVVQAEGYFETVCRYVVLNPVRAGFVAAPEDWRWSSYRATVGSALAPPFLDLEPLLARFGNGDPVTSKRAYADFVGAAGATSERPPADPLWGDEAFVERFRPWIDRAEREVPLRTTALRRSLADIFAAAHCRADRRAGMVEARRARYTVTDIAGHLGLHPSTVSKMLSLMKRVRS